MFKWILKKIKEKNEGFTLVEILVVIAILGVLTAVAVPRLSRSKLTSQVTAHNVNIRILKSAATMYLADNPNIVENTVLTDGDNKIEFEKYLDGEKIPTTPVKIGNIDAGKPYKVEFKNGNIVVTPGEAKVSGDEAVLVTTP
ncbi:MAG: type II secretion system protein [Tissierellia bacterium]|nr:type II secretion system protein [Tissierellia bacterium]